MNITPQELRELDCWIECHIFGRSDVVYQKTGKDCGVWSDADKPLVKHYTTDPAASMEVLEKCLEKLQEHQDIVIGKSTGGLAVSIIGPCDYEPHEYSLGTEAETLESAIALFARNLFSK